jgi:capsular exopolysaccharide synthesis family protein
VPPNPAELLASDRFITLLDELRGVADFVLLDTPPVLAVSDALTVASRADATIMVVDSRSTTRSRLQQAVRHLEKVGARVSGAVLNDVDWTSARSQGYGAYAAAYTENGSRRPLEQDGKSWVSGPRGRRRAKRS